MSGLRVVLADDHPVVRAGLAALLTSLDGIEVVGVASTGREAVREVITMRPDVAVLVLTMFEDDDSVFAAMRAGARGYLLKDADQDEILASIRAVGAGQAVFGPAIAKRMISYFAAAPDVGPQPFPELTPRERDVLERIARGANNAAIASDLALSLKTVRNHVSNIFNKLQVADRAAAIVKARDAGLGG